MTHSDPDTLALRALGEPISVEEEAHLSSCPECRADLESLRAVVGTGRTVTPEDVPAAPPDRVWASIAGSLGVESSATTSAEDAGRPSDGSRPRPLLVVVAAAASVIGLVVGAGLVALVTRDDTGSVIAGADLGPVDGGATHGTATLRETSAGRELDVDLTGLPQTDGYFEVWFMNAETGGAVSLGPLDPGRSTTFPVPAGLVVTDFPFIDVSAEPLDGDPAHSSDSVARGELTPG